MKYARDTPTSVRAATHRSVPLSTFRSVVPEKYRYVSASARTSKRSVIMPFSRPRSVFPSSVTPFEETTSHLSRSAGSVGSYEGYAEAPSGSTAQESSACRF